MFRYSSADASLVAIPEDISTWSGWCLLQFKFVFGWRNFNDFTGVKASFYSFTVQLFNVKGDWGGPDDATYSINFARPGLVWLFSKGLAVFQYSNVVALLKVLGDPLGFSCVFPSLSRCGFRVQSIVDQLVMLRSHIVGPHPNTSMHRIVVAFGDLWQNVNPLVVTSLFPNLSQTIPQRTLYTLHNAGLFDWPGVVMLDGGIHPLLGGLQGGIDKLCPLIRLYLFGSLSHQKVKDVAMNLLCTFAL